MDTDLLSDTKPELPLQLDRSAADKLKAFITGILRQQEKSYATFTVPVEVVDPLSFLEKNWSDQTFQYYWEKPSGEFAIAARGALVSLSASGRGRFAAMEQQRRSVMESAASFVSGVESDSCLGLTFLGGFSFFDEVESADWDSFEAASLTVPKWLITKSEAHCSATVALDLASFHSPDILYDEVISQLHQIDRAMSSAPGQHFPSPVSREVTRGEAANGVSAAKLKSGFNSWISSVVKAKDQIRRKTFEKIVLARRLTVPRERSPGPTSLLNRLRQHYENCSCFLIHPPGDKSYLGATPEQLVAFRHGLLRTEALAGSMKRGQTTTEDMHLEKALSFSAKNRHEHQFVVRDIEQRLRPFAQSIHRSDNPRVKKLSNVQHLYTPIRADLKPGATMLSVLEQLHPTPAVGGYPWEKAASYIRQLENFERGWYAGPVGWLNASGHGEFAVAIRSGLLSKDKAHFFAGCGIVADSNPQTEWKEMNLKLKPMLSVLRYD